MFRKPHAPANRDYFADFERETAVMAVAELSMHVVEGEGGPLLPVCVSVCASRVDILREHTHTTLGERTLAAEIGTSAEGGGALLTRAGTKETRCRARRGS